MSFMKRVVPSPAMTVALGALVVALGGIAVAQSGGIPGPDGVVHGCIAQQNLINQIAAGAAPLTQVITPAGSLRVVASGEPCAAGEASLSFNQRGPAGAPGPSVAPHLYAASATKVKRLGRTMQPLGDLVLPAGSYLLTGDIVIKGSGLITREQFVQCSLIAPDGTTVSSSRVGATLPAGERDPEATIPLSATLTKISSGKFLVDCKDSAAAKGAAAAQLPKGAFPVGDVGGILGGLDALPVG